MIAWCVLNPCPLSPLLKPPLAHAAIVNRQELESWLTGSRRGFPSYTQISYAHLYILTEDVTEVSDDWPRNKFINGKKS
ncbi:hypothetical protein FRC12_016708 [Ceratobasidium sp. 428]|nr:hypothetical protein FRC12_016708 [Ceratobasidium sp. 428]